MLNPATPRTDWTLEEYRLLETLIADHESLRVALRRWVVGLLSVVAGLRYVLPRLASGEAFEGWELLGLGVFVLGGFWLLELGHSIWQDRAEHRARAIESDLATPAFSIGHDLRARPGRAARPTRSPRIGHVMQGEGRSAWRGLQSATLSPRIWVFYLLLLSAFAAWYRVTEDGMATARTAGSAPAGGEHLARIEAAVAQVPEKLERIADSVGALSDDLLRSLEKSAPTIRVDVPPPDLTPILHPLEEIRSGLTAIETAIGAIEPATAPAPTPAPQPTECQGRAWGIGSSSVSCAPVRP